MIILISSIILYLILTALALKQAFETDTFYFKEYHTPLRKIRRVVGVILLGWFLVILQGVFLILLMIVVMIDQAFDLEIL